MADRRTSLRAYLLSVVQDLGRRHQLRSRRGDSLDDILRQEGAAVLASVLEDLQAIATEMGVAFLGKGAAALGKGAHKAIDDLIGAGAQFVMEKIAGQK